MAGHVDSGDVGGVAWLAACGDDLDVGFAGVLTRGESAPVRHDTIFRIASMTKPIVAVGALAPGRGVPAAPRRAGRRAAPGAGRPPGARRATRRRSTVETVPAQPTDHRPRRADVPARARHGLLGTVAAAAARGDGRARARRRSAGAAGSRPSPTSGCAGWRRCRCCTTRASDGCTTPAPTSSVCSWPGPPVSRSTCSSAQRVLEPLGMVDTGFWTAARRPARLVLHAKNPETGERVVYDPPNGQWATPPAFPSGGGGLVSTVDDVPRLRPHAARRRAAARRLAACCRRRPWRR